MLWAAGSGVAPAADRPTKPVKLVNGYPAGAAEVTKQKIQADGARWKKVIDAAHVTAE